MTSRPLGRQEAAAGPTGGTAHVIVDGYSSGKQLALHLRASGASTLHVRSQVAIPSYFLAHFDEADFDEDLGYEPDIDLLVRELEGRDVGTVTAGSEQGVVLADLLAARLGTEGNDPATSIARRDKQAMAERLTLAGLAAPFGVRVGSAAEGVAWYADSGLAEVVVKPADSAGSDNVRFCSSEKQVANACDAVLRSANFFGTPNDSVILQERLEGVEYYVNTVSARGTHRVVEAWQYTKRTGEHPLYDYEEPVAADSPVGRMLRDYVGAALTALGIDNGAAHSEVMLGPRGPVLIETGARLGGGVLPFITEKYAGHSHAGLLARSLVNPDEVRDFDDASVRWWHRVRYVSLINEQSGVVRSRSIEDRLESLPSAVAVCLSIHHGDTLSATCDLSSSPGYVYLVSDDPDELEHDYRTLRRWERDGLYTT